MIRSLPALALVLAALAPIAAAEAPAAIAGASAPAPAAEETAVHSEGGTFKPFYGEVLHAKRWYLFGTKQEFATFRESGWAEMNPMKSKMFIGKGPKRATVVIETDKDAPRMTERLMKQFRARHDLGE